MSGHLYIKKKTNKNSVVIFKGFESYVKNFINHIKSKKYSEMTQRTYGSNIDYFFSFLAANNINRIQEVSLKILEKYRLNLLERNLSPHTVELYIRSVKIFFRYLEDDGEIFANPADKLLNPNPRKKLPVAPCIDDVKKLLNQPNINRPAGIRDRAMIETNYCCGLRASEIMSLNLFSLDIKNKVLYVQGKGNKQRTVPLGKHAVYWVEKYLRYGRSRLIHNNDPDITALWINKLGGSMSAPNYSTNLDSYSRVAGIKRISSHALRRACATHMLNNGAHPVYIQNLLGHADLGTLSQYLMVTVKDLLKTHGTAKVGR